MLAPVRVAAETAARQRKATSGPPAFVGATNGSSLSATVTINVPSGTANGDFMLAILTSSYNTSSSWSTPSGWTLINAPTSVRPYGLFYRVASSEPASYAFATPGSSGGRGFIVAFTNINATPVDQYSVTAYGTITSSWTTPSITTTANGDMVVAGILDGNNITSTISSPFTTASTLVSSSGSGVLGYDLQSSAGAISASGSQSSNVAGWPFTIALKAA